VQIRELRHCRSDVQHDHSDADQSVVREHAERNPTCVGVAQERFVLRADRVFAVAVEIPCRCIPDSSACDEFRSVLLEEDLDALGAVDLADARQLVALENPDLHGWPHLCNIASPATAPPRDSQAIGGAPPFGHTTHLKVFIDPDLLQYDEVWAAAGTWHDVFGIEPYKLVAASDGLVTDLKRG